MARNNHNSMPYDIEPCQIALPGVPIIPDSEQFSDCNRIRIAGITTHSTSVERASTLADNLLRPVRLDLSRGRCQELLKLIELRPEFKAHPWIRAERHRWARSGRSFSKRGRRIGSFETHPLNTKAIVDAWIYRGIVANKEQAFAWLASQDWHDYETAKKQYYQAIRDQRFRADLIQNSIWSTPRPRLKARRLIHRADQLHPGQSITRTLYEFPCGPVTVTLTAT